MAPLLFIVTLCASFQFHRCSQTWVTVRKRSIRVKTGDYVSRVTLKFDGWPWKTIGHLLFTTLSFMRPWNLTDDLEKQYDTFSKQHQALCIISSRYMNPTWSYGPETAEWGSWPLRPRPLTSDLDLLHGLSMVIYPEIVRMIRLEKHCQKGVIGGQTEGRTDGKKCS